jgi:hypothetical protein
MVVNVGAIILALSLSWSAQAMAKQCLSKLTPMMEPKVILLAACFGNADGRILD